MSKQTGDKMIDMGVNLDDLAKFIVRAKKAAYAGEGREVKPQRPQFKELAYTEGGFQYRDSYTGFYQAPGQEVVSFKGNPVWALAYSGGMAVKYHQDIDFALKTFDFLKQALLRVEESRPFRGPNQLTEGDWEYHDQSYGNITRFKGGEKIFYRGEVVFFQDYIGGLIIRKD